MLRCARWFAVGLVALPVALALGVAPPAQAGQISIEFDLQASTISVLGGIINIPPDGSITSAGGTVKVIGSAANAASAGFAQLSGLNLAATVNANPLGLATVTGNAAAAQTIEANGGLTAGLANLVVNPGLVLNISGLINCAGAACGVLLPTNPLNLTGVQTATQAFVLGIGNINSVGNATLGGSVSLTLGGISAVVQFIGSEVSRSFLVPEPNTFALVGLGVIGLAGAGWRRRRGRQESAR